MKVVLKEDVKGIGKKHQIVDVSEGYARNYLLPKNIALIADSKNVNECKTKLEAEHFKKNTEIEEAKKQKRIIEKGYIEFRHKVGDNGRLFGSVTEKEISEKIKEKFGIDIDKRRINLDLAIKQLGVYNASIRLYEGVIAKLKISVTKL